MPNTFVKISTVTVGSSGASDITFSNIPQTFTDLKILLCHRNSTAAAYDNTYMQFNGDTTAGNYTVRWVFGDSGSAGGVTRSTYNFGQVTANSATSSVFSNTEIYIPNYTSSNVKSVSFESVNENNSSTYSIEMTNGRWSGTSAITSIKIFPANNSWMQYSTATLYGIKSS